MPVVLYEYELCVVLSAASTLFRVSLANFVRHPVSLEILLDREQEGGELGAGTIYPNNGKERVPV